MTAEDLIPQHRLDQITVVEILFLYWHNTAPKDIVTDVFPTALGVYAKEKRDSYNDGLVKFWGKLDLAHRNRMMKAAFDKYEGEGTTRIINMKEDNTK